MKKLVVSIAVHMGEELFTCLPKVLFSYQDEEDDPKGDSELLLRHFKEEASLVFGS